MIYDKTLKLTKLVLCWSVLHSACLFADPTISYDHITHLGLTQKANMWGLSTTDYQRYRWLMQNTPSGHWYQALDPAEVLALNARNHTNMKRYALIQARNMHKRVSRELAFNNLYAKAYKQLYPNEKPIMSPGIHELHSITLQAGDRIWLFERVGHTMILGTTRVGKTRLLELMIASDIRRQDSAVIVLDPKGDVDLLKRICYEAKQVGRESDVIVFHLGYPSHSARYNPIGNFARVTEVANRVANQLPSSGESAAFKEFAWRFVNIIAVAMVALGQKPNYKALDRYILNIDPLLLEYCEQWLASIEPEWRQMVLTKSMSIDEKKLPHHLKSRSRFSIALVNTVDEWQLDDPIFEGLKAIFNYDQTYFQKITASLSPLFSKLTTGRIAELISPDYHDLDDNRPIFDWLQVIRGKKIVYVGLDALSDSTVSSAVGNSMFADLCSTIGQIYKFGVQEGIAQTHAKKVFHKINLYSDEFNELAGDEFIPLANKGGGAGLQLTVATQTASDVLARLGQAAKANQVFGNFNSLICLPVLEESTAKLLTDKLPQRIQVNSVIQSSSATDTPTSTANLPFSSHTEDRIVTQTVPLIAADDIMQLPKGQAFCLLSGNQLYKVRFPLPKNDMKALPDSVETLVEWLQIF